VRFHLLGLAHTKTNRSYMSCAYTQKVLKLARMLTDLGHEVIHYGAAGSDVPCEHVSVLTDADQHKAYGDYDWQREFFRHDPNDHAYQTFNKNAIREINARKRQDDFLLVSFGGYQMPVVTGVSIPLSVEMGIGYEGVCCQFRVFESYAWMHYIYGRRNEKAKYYDAVIPNYFDLNDFDLRVKKSGYFAYIGRLIPDKGVQIAIDVARDLGKPLYLAGQGSLDAFKTDGAQVKHVGSLNAEQRNRFLGSAEASFAPTQYIEPFGGVAVEAQLCGTPVITTDWGVYPETVIHGVTGYRCRTHDDFLWAGEHARELDPTVIRKWAESNYSMERVGKMYQEYFTKLYDLLEKGWYTKHPNREDLSWLKRFYD
jgi:glycosyltransferase involved in cell wall biosynthesis